MRVIKALLAIAFVLFGLVFGVLNRQSVHVDVWVRSFDMRLGLLLLTILFVGAFVGGAAVMTGVVWPLRRRQHGKADSASGPTAAEISDSRAR